MKCATHPSVETNLTCGRCGKPICPKCMVMTPVGARCRDCARMRRLPTFDVSPQQYVIAAAVGLGTAAISGAVWYALASVIPFLWLVMALPAGYVIGEAISHSVNRKRGARLQAIAIGSFVVSYVLANVLAQSMPYILAGTAPQGGAIIMMAVRAILGSFFSLYSLIFLAIGVIIAASRLR